MLMYAVHCKYPTTARELDSLSALVVVCLLSRLILVRDLLLVDTIDAMIRMVFTMILFDSRSGLAFNIVISGARVCHACLHSVTDVDITRFFLNEGYNLVFLIGIAKTMQRAVVEYIGAQLDKEDAEEKVAMEKEASEAVLAAVCDATCWLSSDDGDTIQRSNVKLEAILGPDLEGKRLSTLMVDTEPFRLQAAIEAEKCRG